MTATLGSVLEERAAALAGRDRERAALLDLVAADTPLVTAVHGIAGVGKSALLGAFAADARAAGIAVVRLDGREIEPSPDGVFAALAGVLDVTARSLDAVAAAIGALGERVVLAIDTYELLGLADGWIAATLVPALPVDVRVVLASRNPPSGAWVHRYGDLLGTMALGNLAAADAEAVLRRAGVDPAINRIARGHPLALQLAATGGADRAGPPLRSDGAIDAIVEQLGRLYLDGLDAPTRRALAAASVTRRTTLSLLEAMLPEDVPWEAFDRLRRLPFVHLSADGLVVHDTMHAVAGALLRATDPAAHRRYRLAAWGCLRRELREASSDELWRCTADMLFLVDSPVVRQFFFPAMVIDRRVEPARPEDWPEVAALAEHQGFDVGLVEAWWDGVRDGFAVVRDEDGAITGFRCVAERDDVPADLFRRDPIAARWREHLRRDPVPRENRVLFLRWCAIAGAPFEPSSSLAALLLDVKHAYLALRPALRRTYAPLPLWFGADGLCAMALGYAPLPGEDETLPAEDRSLYNDFGPGSIDGWLADLAARELCVQEQTAVDSVRREVRLDGARIDLTQLEFDVLRYLQEREGSAVSREALLRDVWGYEWTGGSNVVEVAISGLRKKLGDRAAALRTVRGVGYRLEPLT